MPPSLHLLCSSSNGILYYVDFLLDVWPILPPEFPVKISEISHCRKKTPKFWFKRHWLIAKNFLYFQKKCSNYCLDKKGRKQMGLSRDKILICNIVAAAVMKGLEFPMSNLHSVCGYLTVDYVRLVKCISRLTRVGCQQSHLSKENSFLPKISQLQKCKYQSKNTSQKNVNLFEEKCLINMQNCWVLSKVNCLTVQYNTFNIHENSGKKGVAKSTLFKTRACYVKILPSNVQQLNCNN